eukprot:3936491-Rhodomonas_salina.4
MSGTDTAYGAIGLWILYAIPGTDLVYTTSLRCPSASAGHIPRYRPTPSLRDVRAAVMLALAGAYPPTRRTALCDIRYGTAYGATRYLRMLLPGRGVRRLEPRARGSSPPMVQRCAMRCPVLAFVSILRASYAVSGTDLGYAATRRAVAVR